VRIPPLHAPFLFLLAVLGAGLAPDAFQQTPQQSRGTGILAGRILDAFGAPVANAVVWSVAGPAPLTPGRGQQGDRVSTNADGRFAFIGLAPGPYRLEASKPGWLSGASGRRRPGGGSTPIDLADGERRNDLAITMWRTAVIGGRVTDDNGDPLIGAEVRAMRQQYVAGRPHYETPIRARTDDRGVYRFSTLIPGDYLVVVLMSVLSEPPTFAGAIRAGGDTPRAYLQTMTSIGAGPMLFERATGVMGSDLPLVTSLSRSLTASAAGQPVLAYATTFHPSSGSPASAKSVRAPSGQAVEDADIVARLAPTWQVSGVLRDADGPLQWHAVHLVPAESGDMPLVDVATAVTDGNGAFTFYGVPRGQYIARSVRIPWPGAGGLAITGGTGAIRQISNLAGPGGASNEPLLHVSQSVAVADRHVRGLSLVMEPGPRVKGLVRFEGTTAEPADLTRVFVRLEAANGRLDSNLTPGALTNDRRFSTASVLPGRYLLRVPSPPAGWTLKSVSYQGRELVDMPFDISADIENMVVTFADQARTIKGTVTSTVAADVPGAQIVIFPVDSAAWVDYGRTSLRVTAATATGTGAFTLALPPDGEYFLAAIADEDSDDWRNPATLKRIATSAERIRVRGESIAGQSLQLLRLK
jgi:hypothetical protein